MSQRVYACNTLEVESGARVEIEDIKLLQYKDETAKVIGHRVQRVQWKKPISYQ